MCGYAWNHATTLAIESILSTGKRTVTSALRVMGLREKKRFTNFHRVLNRAKWSSLQGAIILFELLVDLLPANLPLIILIMELDRIGMGKQELPIIV
jgi:hypothetical protein